MYVNTTDTTLTVVLEGKEQLFAFKAKVVVPKGTIQSISYHKTFSEWRGMEIRIPGSYMPSWLMAGSYWTDQGWDFIYAKKPKGVIKPELTNVLVINTDLNRYNRIIIGLPQNRSKELIDWFNESK